MNGYVIAAAILSLLASAVSAQALKGPVNDAPLTENWWPSKWGADDKAGSANHTRNPANIRRALAVVKQFKAITIGKHYHHEIPMVGNRTFYLTVTPILGPFGKNAKVSHSDVAALSIGQVGTQFDGPGHVGVNTSKGPMFYNGRMAWDAYENGNGAVGMGPLGVEHVGELGFVCRLVVLDAVAYLKQLGKISSAAETLPVPDSPTSPGIVTADDVKAIMKMEGLSSLQPGDCVALHTGYGSFWSNSKFKSMTSQQRLEARSKASGQGGLPGFGYSACRYLIAQDIALQMIDTENAEARPNEEKELVIPCHTEGQTRHGIWHMESVDTQSLVDSRIYEGAFIWAPLRIVGATGSPGNPMVLY